MTVAIMQPYFLPYIGYFQLIQNSDQFVVYDNIQYTKKGWINRNRILVNGADAYITLPLKKDSDFLNVSERYLSDEWLAERKKLLNRITESYRKAPEFEVVFPLLKEIINCEEKNLFAFLFNSLKVVKHYLDITTPLVVSSTVNIDHGLKAEKKVIELCKALKADKYINPIGGVELYNKDEFLHQGIKLQFMKTTEVLYEQLNNTFVPFLSIVDVMMFNKKEKIKQYLNQSFTLQ